MDTLTYWTSPEHGGHAFLNSILDNPTVVAVLSISFILGIMYVIVWGLRHPEPLTPDQAYAAHLFAKLKRAEAEIQRLKILLNGRKK